LTWDAQIAALKRSGGPKPVPMRPPYTAPDGWNPMASAPMRSQHIRVVCRDGTVHEDAHWTSDLSGEEQPAFQGWFIPCGGHFAQIEEPVGWLPRTNRVGKEASCP